MNPTSSELSGDSGIGLKNVLHRLQIYFGEEIADEADYKFGRRGSYHLNDSAYGCPDRLAIAPADIFTAPAPDIRSEEVSE